MNKYLEKIAFHPTAQLALLGGVIGSTAGLRTKDPIKHKRFTKAERIKHTLAGVTLGTIYGGSLGVWRQALRDQEFVNSFNNFAGYKKQTRSILDPGDLKQHFRDMGGAGFKTKAQAHAHYKAMASKFHPDRPKGSTEKMQKLNEAWMKAKAHPDFQKMASSNTYLEKMSGVFIKYLNDPSFIKKVQGAITTTPGKIVEKEREPGCGMKMHNPVNQTMKIAEMIKIVSEKKKPAPDAIIDTGRHINGDNPP